MRKETKTWIRRGGALLFLLYLLALAYFLFFSETYGRVVIGEGEYHYNLIPFQEIRRFWIYREQVGTFAWVSNLLGNVIGFLPFGFILPVIFRNFRSFWSIMFGGFLFSLLVETIQLVTKVGCFDVDDLILNTLGAILGYLAFMLCDKIRRMYYGKKI
ncbi:MAG TPA: VanZ family protein [Candidatus Blautia gallistercoris]|uniref:VanZ family protein n=1 Tax=Candidatus Blautia gallistercoris TaxID=2838490 RepID=A0A9D1WJ19_9FIRM|nr:VanZ family protein [Candidatus Blautia gallistercoris]